MTTMEERVSRLEGGYEHLATKADVMAVHAEIARLQAAQSNRLIVDIQADRPSPRLIQSGWERTCAVGATRFASLFRGWGW